MKPLITVNLSYYNQKDVLLRHVLSWKSYSESVKKNFTFCIVDDCSKTPADEVLSSLDISDIDVKIYRVTEDL